MKRTHWLSIGLFICALFGVFVASGDWATAQEESPPPTPAFSVIGVESARVRSAPNETALSIGTLLRDARVTAYNRDETGQWVLVNYAGGFGWIRRDLALWAEDIDTLPILTADNLTPTPALLTPSVTPRLVTLTPVGSYVMARVNVFVRTGPGIGFVPLGVLNPGSVIEPLNIDETGTWVLIRFSYNQRPDGATATQGVDGFGWVTRNVILWTVDINQLPILYDDALTPTLTYTPTYTPSATPSATSTLTVTASSTATSTNTSTATPSATNTDVPTATYTDTPTDLPTETATDQPTETPTNTDVPTATATETPTAIPSATNTDVPTATATETPTAIPSATNTDVPTETPSPEVTALDVIIETATKTDVPTETATNTDVPTPTNTDVPTETPSPEVTALDVPFVVNTETPSPEPTEREISPAVFGTEVQTLIATTINPTETASLTPTMTAIPTTTDESTPEVTALVDNPTEMPLVPQTPVISDQTISESSPFPIEALLAGGALFSILTYVVLYWRGQVAVDRYANGFVIQKCPVCGVGHLEVETRVVRLLGIPRPRRTVRCDHCRSLLRETGNRRWRYAVDKLANLAMYDRYNGLEVDERTLQKLADNPIRPSGED